MRFKDFITCLVSLTVLIGAVYAAERHYAKYTHVCMLEMRFDQKQLWDRKKDIENRVWDFEYTYGDASAMPQSMQTEYRKLKQELEEIEYELDNLKKE